MSKIKIILFVALITLISSETEFIVHSHSGSWCDYWTGNGLVNIQVIQKGPNLPQNVTFNMTLQDYNRNKYNANCTIEQKAGDVSKDPNSQIVPRAYCYFDPPILNADLTYKKNTLDYNRSNHYVEIEDDFYVISQKCTNQVQAKKTADLRLSFRQISTFRQLDKIIKFFFYGLTTRKIEQKDTITIYIYLYLERGVKEKDPRPANCTLLKDIIDPKSDSKQAPFECRIDGLDKQYHTIKFSSSDDVAGVPFGNEILLDPKLTDEAIKNKTLPNYTETSEKDEVPMLINVTSIYTDDCKSNGSFVIKGKLNVNISEPFELNIPMTFPYGTESICTIPNSTAGNEVQIMCEYKSELEIENQTLIIEQRALKIGDKEYLIEKVESNKTSCKNADLLVAEKKINSTLSFRQINKFNIDKSKNKDKIYFKFFGLTTKVLPEEFKEISIYVILIENGTKPEEEEIEATCIIDEKSTVNVSIGQVQVKYDCSISNLDKNKNYTSLKFNSSEEINSIPENETLLDPVKTEKAINQSIIIDYSIPEKQNLTVKFKPRPKPINATTCSEKGEFKIVGDIDQNITEPFNFTVPVFYPEPAVIKCSIDKTPNGTAELKCNTNKKLIRKKLMIEQQILRNKDGKELLFLDKVKSGDEPDEEIYCNVIPANETTLPIVLVTEEEKKEDAKDKAKLGLSFRQINNFSYIPASKTIFVFIYVLASDNYKRERKMKIKANLIKKNGTVEDEAKDLNCVLINTSTIVENKQGVFNCSLSNLNEDYYSLRLNSSDLMTGIPTEEVLLDPILTAKAIEKKKIKDNKVPLPKFKFKSIKPHEKEKHKIVIIGTPTNPIERDFKFILPLSYPEGVSMTCTITKPNSTDMEFTCLTDRNITDQPIFIEQTIIRDGPEEVLNFEGINLDANITCDNGLLTEADKKLNITKSFRQVSHLKEDKDNNKFTFFLAALYPNYTIPENTILLLKIFVIIDKNKKEKTANCTFKKEVELGDKRQGNFNCEVLLTKDEFNNTNFKDPESIIVSPYNDEINGVSELNNTDLSPLYTDIAINKTKEDENPTELSECIDYSLDENNITLPPTLEIQEINDTFDCSKSGKLGFKVKPSSPIEKEKIFMLPLSFPSSKLKCKVNEVNKTEDGKEVDIVCKVQKEFKSTQAITIEDRIVKKRHKEMFFIKNKNKRKDFTVPLECKNFNEIKLEKAKRKMNKGPNKFSFWKLSKFKPIGKKVNFFLGLFKLNKEGPDFNVFTNRKLIPIRVIVNQTSNLRRLDGTTSEELKVDCVITEKTTTTAGLNCTSDDVNKGEPINMTLNTDDLNKNDDDSPISGIPDDEPPANKDQNTGLDKIDNLPVVEIKSIDDSKCEEDGSYTIKGKVTDGTLQDYYKNVEIPFSTPDSGGVCNITVSNNKEDVEMNCQNKEEFEASTIMLDTMIVKDSSEKELFKIKDYINQDKLSCIVSVKSDPEPEDKNSTEYTEPTPSQGTAPNSAPKTDTINNNSTTTEDEINYFPTQKKNARGLSGGAIAAIVICSVIALAVVGALIALGISKSRSPVAPVQPVTSNIVSSTLNNLSYEPKP